MQTAHRTRSLLIVALLAQWACGPEGHPAGAGLDPGLVGPAGDVAGGGGEDGGSTGALSASLTGLPCDVATVLSSYCLTCHGVSLAGSAPVHLTSLDDLQSAALTDPAQTLGELSLIRMRDDSQPMPPAGARVPEVDIQAFEAWVQAGMPAGECQSSSVDDTFAGPVTCTTNSYWRAGNRESPEMHPGMACIDCHALGVGGERGPRFAVAGTLFASGHEPDDCNGVNGSVEAAKIEITDKSGKVQLLSVNRAGNFYEETSNLTFPITARVLYDGRSRAMLTPQMSGDCNSCHTESGTEGAPGRIALP